MRTPSSVLSSFHALVLVATTFVEFPAMAEYRVYQLAITNTQTAQARNVISTLDHLQYPTYYPIRPFETIALQATWMCWGRHGEGQRPCPNPRADGAAPTTSSSAPRAPAAPAR